MGSQKEAFKSNQSCQTSGIEETHTRYEKVLSFMDQTGYHLEHHLRKTQSKSEGTHEADCD